uniref:Transmembrane protein n=1 Tax=Trypanosoma congolense (strain IL3000) TaxID=1068625 RepID=G0UQ09_TRYCI|nr:conserved hypothetical protein [Trypanosoma congolense IL3000]
MLRRALPLANMGVRCALTTSGVSLRHSHHKTTHHDFSDVFARQLTSEEAEAFRRQQEKRTVSSVVPGKMFMRHWIPAEQATDSVVDRVLSGFVFVCFMLWGCAYATLGFNGSSCAQMSFLVFLTYWLFFKPIAHYWYLQLSCLRCCS